MTSEALPVSCVANCIDSFSSRIPGPRALAVERQRDPRVVGEVERQVVRPGLADPGAAGNIVRGASLKAIEMIRMPSAIFLPVRR